MSFGLYVGCDSEPGKVADPIEMLLGGIRDYGVIAQYNRECYTTVDNPENWPQNTAVCLLGMSALCEYAIVTFCIFAAFSTVNFFGFSKVK